MKKPQAQLKEEIIKAAARVRIGGIYSHYKNPAHTYRVIDLAINTESDTVWVVYKSLYEEEVVFLRSVEEWCDDVEKDGRIVKRFTSIKS